MHAYIRTYEHTHTHTYSCRRKRMSGIYKRGKAVTVRIPNLKDEARKRREDLMTHMRERAKRVTSSCNLEVRVCMEAGRHSWFYYT